MRILDIAKGKKAIRSTAKSFGLSEKEIRKEMQLALDEAWNTSDPEAKELQNKLFPNGKPTLEEFIIKAGKMIR